MQASDDTPAGVPAAGPSGDCSRDEFTPVDWLNRLGIAYDEVEMLRQARIIASASVPTTVPSRCSTRARTCSSHSLPPKLTHSQRKAAPPGR